MGPEEGHDDDQRAGALPLREEAESLFRVSYTKENAGERPYSRLLVLTGDLQKGLGGTP